MSKPVFKSTASGASSGGPTPEPATARRPAGASFSEDAAACDYIFREGELGTEMFILQEGQVEILKTVSGTDEQLAILGEDERIVQTRDQQDVVDTEAGKIREPCEVHGESGNRVIG